MRSRSSSGGLAADDRCADRAVDHRIQELLGKERRVGRCNLSIVHGVGENVGNQLPHVDGVRLMKIKRVAQRFVIS